MSEVSFSPDPLGEEGFDRILLNGEHIGYVYPVAGVPGEWLADTAVRPCVEDPRDWSPTNPFTSREDAVTWAIRRHTARVRAEAIMRGEE